jgi:hypothetical protein
MATYRRLIRGFSLCAVAMALLAAVTQAQTSPGPMPATEEDFAPEIARFVEADRAAPPAACQVLFVGSSSIVKWKEHLAIWHPCR